MTISRDTYDSTKQYRAVVFHEDRALLDCELNEMLDLINERISALGYALFKSGMIISGCTTSISSNVLNVASGYLFIDGSVEAVGSAALTFSADKTSGLDYVYAELLKYNVGYSTDDDLYDPRTGLATAEREKWVVSVKQTDTTSDDLPTGATDRIVVQILSWNRETNAITRIVGYPHDEPGPIGKTTPGTIACTSLSSPEANLNILSAGGFSFDSSSASPVTLILGKDSTRSGVLTICGDTADVSGKIELKKGSTATGISTWSIQANATGVLSVNDGTDDVVSVDGGNNRLGVNVEAPTAALDVSGDAKISGSLLVYSITSVTGTGAPTGGSAGDIKIQADGIWQNRAGTWTLITS